MDIHVIAVGRLKEKFWIQAADEYLKRAQPYARVAVREVPDRDPGKAGGVEQALAQEGADILKAIDPQEYVILLDIAGKQLSSEELAATIEELGVQGRPNITFVVGGSVGVSSAVRDRADLRISFGRQTLPHNLARIVLLEQVYRAFKIIKREPYHK